jgi:nitroimidazol reductase NimA-like FMN-containing flavoprotein (pyridoxamine 5'-phosphate oxidase superfamily)
VSDGEGGDPVCWADLPVATGRPRPLTATEIGALLARDLVAHVGTVDADGFPHVTPIWFLWDGDAFVLSCRPNRPHVARLRANSKASILIDDEEPERSDGERPNRQVRAVGQARIFEDVDGASTTAIWRKYLRSASPRPAGPRVVIRLVPTSLVAVASV